MGWLGTASEGLIQYTDCARWHAGTTLWGRNAATGRNSELHPLDALRKMLGASLVARLPQTSCPKPGSLPASMLPARPTRQAAAWAHSCCAARWVARRSSCCR